MSFGANLAKIRRKLGLQISALETCCGIPRQRLSEFESEKTKPTLTEVLALAYVFGTTPQELLDMPTKTNAKKVTGPNPQTEKTETKKQTAAVTAPSIPENGSEGKAEAVKESKGFKNKAEAAKVNKGSENKAEVAKKNKGSKSKKVQEKNNAHQKDEWTVDEVTEALQQLQNVNGENAHQKKTTEASSTNAGETFGKRMQAAKKKLNLSYTTITKELGITLTKYIQFELDATEPDEALKAKIVALLMLDK